VAATTVTPVGSATTRPTTAIMRNRGETVRFVDIPEVDLQDEREAEQIALPPPRTASARPNTSTIMTSYSSSSFESDELNDNASEVSSDWDSSEAEDEPVTFAAAASASAGVRASDDVEAPTGSDDVNAEEEDTFPVGVTPSASSSTIDGGWTRPFTAQVEPIGKAPDASPPQASS
jgi:hypothetical protein